MLTGLVCHVNGKNPARGHRAGARQPGISLSPGRLSRDVCSSILRPGVIFREGLLDPVGGDLGINLCCGDVGMPEHLLDRPQVSTAFKQMRCETVTDRVGRKLDTDLFPDRLERLPETLPGHRPARSGHKQIGGLLVPDYGRSFRLYILPDSGQGTAVDRNHTFLVALPQHPDEPCLEMNIAEFDRYQFTHPQS